MAEKVVTSIEPNDHFKSEGRSIKTIFLDGNRKFIVPDYQRNFAWTKDEIEPFLSDFMDTYNNAFDVNCNYLVNPKPHFFGTILLTKTADYTYEITDGQQRLTVATIFLKILFETSFKITNGQQRSGIQTLIAPLIFRSSYGEPFEARLELDETVNDFFQNFILVINNDSDRNDYLRLNSIRPQTARQRLKEAYDLLKKHISNEFPDSLNQEQLHNKLIAYIQTFTRLFTFLEIIVQNKDTAYTIFGTINNRGKDLTDSEIIKNEVFKAVVNEVRRSEIKDRWNSIIDSIENEDLTDYLRFQYASINGPVKKVELFSAITKLLQTMDPIDYLDQLKVEADWFARVCLIEPNHWNDQITSLLKAFESIDVTHGLPLLLTGAILFNNDENTFKRLVNATLVFCFRYFTIGRESVENLEREIGQMSKWLRRHEKNLDEIIEYMRGLTTDTIFVSDFGTARIKSTKLAFYIINELEKDRMQKSGLGIIPLPHSPKQHIEHIMPKTPSNANARQNEWAHVRNRPDYNEYVFRLGNQLILESGKNRNASNYEFDQKKKIYLTSGLSYPQEIAKSYPNWDINQIESRQQSMAREALNIWGY